MKIKKGDTVLITTGKDKGKKGKVMKVFPQDNKIIVENLNIKKRHTKPKRQGEKGGILAIPNSFPVSKAMLVCPKCGKAAKVGQKITGENKYRICKECLQEI